MPDPMVSRNRAGTELIRARFERDARAEAEAYAEVAVSVDKCLDSRKNHNSVGVDEEDELANLAEVIKGAMSLDVRDRAVLAEKLLASLDELSEGEADRLWAEESQRRLDQYHAGQAKAISADAVHAKVNKLLR